MMIVTIKRVFESFNESYGVLILGNRPRFVTLERGWRDNRPRESCIPKGSYTCCEHVSPRFGDTYLVTNVPGRSEILFHAGNFYTDTEGCILVGTSFANGLGQSGITNSKTAFLNFLRLLKDIKSFQLEVI